MIPKPTPKVASRRGLRRCAIIWRSEVASVVPWTKLRSRGNSAITISAHNAVIAASASSACRQPMGSASAAVIMRPPKPPTAVAAMKVPVTAVASLAGHSAPI